MPKIYVGPRGVSDIDEALTMEWIVTNGIGGYSSSTILGVNTRKHHGMLVAALKPPLNRWVLLAKVEEEAELGDSTFSTSCNEFIDRREMKGYGSLVSFTLDPFPVFFYSLGGLQLWKRIFMPYRKNTTVILYEVLNTIDSRILFRVSPLVSFRYFHRTLNHRSVDLGITQEVADTKVVMYPPSSEAFLLLDSNMERYIAEGKWIEDVKYRTDEARGDIFKDDYFQAGFFESLINPLESKSFYLVSVGEKTKEDATKILDSLTEKGMKTLLEFYRYEIERRRDLLITFKERHSLPRLEDWLRWLLLAADSFLVERESLEDKSVIAGYPWFEDWGRDTLISLPGLTLVTGRYKDAKDILRTFARYCKSGVIPNRFSDFKEGLDYNAVDSSLWYVNAVFQYFKYTRDLEFIESELWDTLTSIIHHYKKGTFNGIHLDSDGLIEHGPRLTWMDVSLEGKPVTPRDGKAVEVQALWYNALKIMSGLAEAIGRREEAKSYQEMADKTKRGFQSKFWSSEGGYLYDTIKGGEGDPTLRPNQIFAISLDFSMLKKEICKKVTSTLMKHLWAHYGLKTLPSWDPRYIGRYRGSWSHREKAYHNGTVWAWLAGPLVTAFLKVNGYEPKWRKLAFEYLLKPLFLEETYKAGLGTLSEIFDGDPPHRSAGCISQAWSVAEPLRAYIEEVLHHRPPYEETILRGVNFT